MFETSRPSGRPPYWVPGTAILWRYRRRGHPNESMFPMVVVDDGEDALVAWLPPGTPILRPVLPDGRDLRSVGAVEMYASGRALMRDTWGGGGTLRVAPTGQPWSTFVFWDEHGDHVCWYVNLEDPHRRDDSGIVTQDHVLDLVVAPDRTVQWKDVDELEGAVVAGRYTQAEADSFLEHARDVEKLIAAWESPFCDGWERWRPDPGWPVPQLPDGTAADY
ncbi:MAG: DUF402 domain-containing protein [Acidimicrobiales bacterium]